MTTTAMAAIAPIFFVPIFLMKEAFSLVLPEVFSCSGFAGVIADSLLSVLFAGFPHFAQKAAPSSRGAPHFVQNLGVLMASVIGSSCESLPLDSLSIGPAGSFCSSERGFFASLFRRSCCMVLRDPQRRFLPQRSGVWTDGQRHENRGSQAGWQTCGCRTAF